MGLRLHRRRVPPVDVRDRSETELAARRARAALQRSIVLEDRGRQVGESMRDMNRANHITEMLVDLLRGS